MTKTRSASGFTLVEILITLVILAVLAGIAIPAFFRTVEQSRGNEALTNLNIIHMGEKIYRLNNASFIANTTIALLNADLNTDMMNNFYEISAMTAGADDYSITLERVGGTKTFTHTFDRTTMTAPVLTEGGSY